MKEMNLSHGGRPNLGHLFITFCVFVTCSESAVTTTPPGPFPFQNANLPWHERVDDLVSRLTVDEIQLQMTRGGGNAPAIPRLGIHAYDWSTECLHGAANYNGNETAFPQAIGLAAAFSMKHVNGDQGSNSVSSLAAKQSLIKRNATLKLLRMLTKIDTSLCGGAHQILTACSLIHDLVQFCSPELLHRVATAIGVEVRAKHNDYVRQGLYFSFTGADCFSPVVNIARDPRWGRNQETYGEDPFMSGVLAQHFVRGLQGNDSRYARATAGCKHFDVHGGPENIPENRFSFNAEVSDLDWRMTFLPAFKKCVQAGTFSLMCSYNRINGVPACANKKLLTDILRNEWNFTGYVVSDEGALEFIISNHHYLNNSVDAAAACVNAGMNLELPVPGRPPVYMSIVDALKQGKVTEDTLRSLVKPLFYTRMRVGEFDPPEHNPYSSLDLNLVESPEHQALAVEAAIKSFVLLKNINNTLPLDPAAYKNVAIVGPMADTAIQIFGDYSAKQDRGYTKTPIQGLQELFPDIVSGEACLDGPPCKSYQSQAVRAAVAGADLVFVALGTGTVTESEGRDRPDVNLPGNQSQVLTDTLSYNSHAKIILLLFNAGPLNLTIIDGLSRVSAILECFFPAQATGDAIAAIIVNKGGNSSPAGRVPITWPKYDWQIPPMINYSMVGRTYRYLETDPLYPFGYGLSYSTFSFANLHVISTNAPRHDVSVSITILNNGNLNADEVVQCYIQWGNRSLPVPRIQLVYFNRINIKAKSQVTHSFQVHWESWSYWNQDHWAVQTGLIRLYCGGQQPFQKKAAPSNVLSVEFGVVGDDKANVQEKLVKQVHRGRPVPARLD